MKPLSDSFSPEVLAELSRPYEPRDPRHAEIVEGGTPSWHVVEVFASAQADVAAVSAGVAELGEAKILFRHDELSTAPCLEC